MLARKMVFPKYLMNNQHELDSPSYQCGCFASTSKSKYSPEQYPSLAIGDIPHNQRYLHKMYSDLFTAGVHLTSITMRHNLHSTQFQSFNAVE